MARAGGTRPSGGSFVLLSNSPGLGVGAGLHFRLASRPAHGLVGVAMAGRHPLLNALVPLSGGRGFKHAGGGVKDSLSVLRTNGLIFVVRLAGGHRMLGGGSSAEGARTLESLKGFGSVVKVSLKGLLDLNRVDHRFLRNSLGAMVHLR